MSRLLAQPIYRDALLLGKLLAGVGTLALALTTISLLIMGMGILRLAVPPSGAAVARGALFLLVTILYGAVWLALAMLFSTTFRQTATAALAALAVWLFFTIFWGIVASLVAGILRPIQTGTLEAVLGQAQLELFLTRLSPNTLLAEATVALLNPETRALGFVLPWQMEGAIRGSTLPLS